MLGGVSAVVLTLSLNSHPLPAAADPFPGNGSQTIADGPSHYYCFSDGFSGTPNDPELSSRFATVRDAMNRLRSTTVMSTVEVSACDVDTDIKWVAQGLVGPGRRGNYRCKIEYSVKNADYTICDTATLTLDFDAIDESDNKNGYDDEKVDRLRTAVHEVGHSVGLGHPDEYCHFSAMSSFFCDVKVSCS